MDLFERGDQVISPLFGIGQVILDDGQTVIVRFAQGIEDCVKKDLRKILTPRQTLALQHWHLPLQVIARIQSMAIQSVNDAWGVFSLSRVALLPHQLWVCRRVVENWPTRWLVADDVGLGKTVEGGLILSSLLAKNTIQRILLLCPASLVSQWQIRLRTMFDLRFTDYLAEADTPHKDFWDTHNHVVASLETLRLDHNGRHNRLLESKPWDLLIVDEAHHLNADEKTGPTLGYQLVEKLVNKKQANSMVFFTGTPHRGKNYGFLSLLHLLSDKFDPKINLYSQLHMLPKVMIRNNKQNVTDLKGNRLFQPPIVTSETYRYSETEAKFYQKLTEFIIGGKAYASSLTATEGQVVILVLISMQKLASSSVAAIRRALRGRLTRIQQGHTRLENLKTTLANYHESTDMGDTDKVNEMEEEISELTATLRLVEDEEPRLEELIYAANAVEDETKLKEIITLVKKRFSDRSVLFFTEYKATQSLLMSYLIREFGDDCVTFINGDDKAEEIVNRSNKVITKYGTRENAADKFKSGEVQFLVSTEAGGEGIDLQENCNTLIHVDLPWNPMRLHQRVGRLNRYGQRKQVEVFTFRNLDTVESIIWDKLNSKLDDIKLALNEVMDEPEDLLQLVLGMTSPGLFNEIFSEANEIPHETLTNWFSQKTMQLGGKDMIEVVRELIGNSSRFDFQQMCGHIPQVDLPNLIPFFKTMLHLNMRRYKEDNLGISFKTPEDWLKDPGIRTNYDGMVFDRSIQGKNAVQRVLGIGQKVFQQAIMQAQHYEVSIATVSNAILDNPLYVFRIYDRITNSSNVIRSTIAGIEINPENDQRCTLIQDWKLLIKLNDILENKKAKLTETINYQVNPQVVENLLEKANKEILARLSELDISFQVPEFELQAILWPSQFLFDSSVVFNNM